METDMEAIDIITIIGGLGWLVTLVIKQAIIYAGEQS